MQLYFIKVIAHWVLNFRMRFSVVSYSSSFPIKMNATDVKTQKIKPDPIVCDGRKFRRQCVNVRSYLFFNMRQFQMKILCAETFTQYFCIVFK